jgi:hypothetical protein
MCWRACRKCSMRCPAKMQESASACRVKLLNPTANPHVDEARGSSAISPFRRLTARLPGPRLCLSPQPHRVRHELRPPALPTPARHPGSGRRPGRRIAPSLHPRRVGSFPYITTGPCCVDPAGRRSFRDPQGRENRERAASVHFSVPARLADKHWIFLSNYPGRRH